MAFSGTVSQTQFNTRRVMESAFRRARVSAELISAEYIDIANDQLFLILSDLANQGAPLWCIEKQVYPLYDGIGAVTLDTGTVDVLNSNLRWLQEVTGANSDAATYRIIDFGNATPVSTVGILWSTISAPVSLDRSDDGLTWETIQTETPDATSGQWTWFDLASVVPARFFRVLATSGTLGLSRLYTGNIPTEIPLARLNRDDYANLPNKVFQSNRPLQFWFDRQIPRPVMRLWPIPNDAASVMQIVVWRQRYIMDVGSMTQEIEVPQRWYQALVSMLAARLAWEINDADKTLIPMLEGKAAQDLATAQAEERDNSPIHILPDFSAYTR